MGARAIKPDFSAVLAALEAVALIMAIHLIGRRLYASNGGRCEFPPGLDEVRCMACSWIQYLRRLPERQVSLTMLRLGATPCAFQVHLKLCYDSAAAPPMATRSSNQAGRRVGDFGNAIHSWSRRSTLRRNIAARGAAGWDAGSYVAKIAANVGSRAESGGPGRAAKCSKS